MPSANSKILRLVQFNVENLFIFLDLYKNQDLKKITESEWQSLSSSTIPNKPLRKVQALAEILLEINADIIMLNEVGGIESLVNFNKYFLDSRYTVHLKEGNSNRGIDIGYLVRADLDYKAILISHKDRPINFLYPHETQTPSGGKSHYFSRDIAELRLFKPKENSPCLTLLLTHLKSKLDSQKVDPQGKLRRAAELSALVEIYNEIKNELGEQTPLLISGDFNGIASRQNTEPEFAPLYEKTDLTDALEIAEKPIAERFTQVQITNQGQRLLLQIDYIFISPTLRPLLVHDETYVYRFKGPAGAPAPIPRNLEERGVHASDHYPVVITLSWS